MRKVAWLGIVAALACLISTASVALAAPPQKVAVSGTESLLTYVVSDRVFKGPFEYFNAIATGRLECDDPRVTGETSTDLDYKVRSDGRISFSGIYNITLDSDGEWRGKMTGGNDGDGIWYATLTARGYGGSIDGARLSMSFYDYGVEGVLTVK